MSRIGRHPITIPANTQVEFKDGNVVLVKGQLGQLERKFNKEISFEKDGDTIKVIRCDDSKEARALHGLSRTLLSNMIEGVTHGFTKKLIVNGVGFKAQKQGNKLVLELGFSKPKEVLDADGVTTSCPSITEVEVKGIDKEKVGQFAAKIRDIKRVEPYHLYGIRYADEVVIKKEGSKTAGKK